MRTILLASTLLASVLVSTPTLAVPDVFTWSPCSIEGSCTIVQRYDVGYEAIDTDFDPHAIGGLTGDAKFPPIPIDPRVYGYIVGQRHTPSEPDWIVWSSVPADVIIFTPVTITNTESGDSSTFNIVLDVIGIAADVVARRYGLPFAGEVGTALNIISLIRDGYGPATDAAYAGVQNMVQGIIDKGVQQMNSDGVPIGPDPTFTFSTTIENTTFSGSFDAYGDINSINNIHDVSLFVDGVSASPLAAIPETSTWVMMLIGFVALCVVGGRRRSAA